MNVVSFVQTTIIFNKGKKTTQQRGEKRRKENNYNPICKWIATVICIVADQFLSVLLWSSLGEYLLLVIDISDWKTLIFFSHCKNNFLLFMFDS